MVTRKVKCGSFIFRMGYYNKNNAGLVRTGYLERCTVIHALIYNKEPEVDYGLSVF